MNVIELKQFSQLEVIQTELAVIKQFIEEHQAESFTKKQVVINENIKANFLEYQTKEAAEQIWEAHKKDIDIHYMVKGEEIIALGDHLEAGEYHEEEDYYLLQEAPSQEIRLQKGQLLVLFTEEAHKTGGQIHEKASLIQKIVFKVRKSTI